MTIPHLPQDIIDTIVQIFAEIVSPDKEQVKKLCFVSRAFVPQCQRYIFHTVLLLRDGYRDPFPPYHPFGERINVLGRRLHHLLQTSPHLLGYIRVLKVHAWASAELAWIASMGEEAAAILSACHALQTLELGSESPIEWSIMHPSLQTSLISRIQSLQLNNLALTNVKHIPILLLATFRSLKGLRLDNVSFDVPQGQLAERIAGNTPTFEYKNSLERLSIADSNPIIRNLLDRKIISPHLTVLELRYRHDGKDKYVMLDLLKEVSNIQELYVALLPNGELISTFFSAFLHANLPSMHYLALDGLNSIDISPLQNLCHISILTRPDILRDTYTIMKNFIEKSHTLETANVLLPLINEQWWDWTCLNAIRVWAEFSPEAPFRQLSLSFVVPQSKDSDTMYVDLYSSLNEEFARKLGSLVGTSGNDLQLLDHVVAGRVRIAYIFSSYRVIWMDTLSIWRLMVDNEPTGRVPWHIWDPTY